MPVTKLHAPLALTVAVPSWVDPSNTSTVLLASPVPVNVSVVALVISSPTAPLSGENEAIVGAASGPIIGSTVFEAALVLPAVSVTVAVKTWEPLASVPVV